ncbi:putative F-box protein [Panicum miliaceum]|uniref:F-box protein n=1 Tax=Panicum miliaceum TaxID=4540 RepID=A0A3L6SJ19_PANMI|nr:putative F-box protein [Panicum miliaceum]
MQGLFYMQDGNVFGFSFVDLAARSMPLDIDSCFSFLTELPGIQNLLLQNSCNGLVLFENRQKPYSRTLGYTVCNPTTKQWVAVPTCGSPEMLTYTYLAFDPALSSHFHLVQLQVEDAYDMDRNKRSVFAGKACRLRMWCSCSSHFRRRLAEAEEAGPPAG